MNDTDLIYLNVTRGFKILGANAFDPAGTSVNDAGDINGDGVNDLIVGAPGASPSGRSYAGTAYVVYGKADGVADVDLSNLTPAQGFKILGANAFDRVSTLVSGVEDINGDGFDDFIIGDLADAKGGEDTGNAYVIYGKAGGVADVDLLYLTHAQGFKILGRKTDDNTGSSVSSAEEIDWEGIMLGAPQADAGGVTYDIYGKPNSVVEYGLFTWPPVQGFKIPESVSGDDAGPDTLIGAPTSYPSGRTTYVIYGKAGGFDSLGPVVPAQGFKILGSVSSDEADPDIILGAPEADSSGRDNVGAAYDIYGKPNIVAEDYLFNLESVIGDEAGPDTLIGESDIIQGGAGDDILDEPYADPSGRTTYVIYGKYADVDPVALTLDQSFKILRSVSDNEADWSINREWYDEVIIGASSELICKPDEATNHS
jgi:hypothetical protein